MVTDITCPPIYVSTAQQLTCGVLAQFGPCGFHLSIYSTAFLKYIFELEHTLLLYISQQ